MKTLLTIFFSLFSFFLLAQDDEDPFSKFGPPGAVYTNMKDALKEAKSVYKLKLDNQPLDPKVIPKLNKLTEVQVLQFTSNGLTELPNEICDLHYLIYLS